MGVPILLCTMASKKQTKPTKTPAKAQRSRDVLLAMIEQHLATYVNVTPEGFGWAAIKDTRLVPRLRDGGDITTGKMDDVLLYLAKFNPPQPKE